MPNSHRVRTSDPTFAASLMAYLGEDITLPDNSVVQAIVHVQESTEGADMMGNAYTAITYGKIPTAKLGTLQAGQVVVYQNSHHYVPTLQPAERGWSVFTLEETTPQRRILAIQGRPLAVPTDTLIALPPG